MQVKVVQKYQNKSLSSLKSTAVRWFNEYIRLRDTDDNGRGFCISSGQPLRLKTGIAQAGHYYAAGNYENLRFNEDNVHLQGLSDNYFKSGNQLEYRKNLIRKIGQDRVDKLDMLADFSKRKVHKWDRFDLIEIIETYKSKVKELRKEKVM